jgi:hypothetical protein
VLATVVDPYLWCAAVGTYQLTCTFEWQKEDDSHTVTFYIDGWKATGTSVDG